MVSLVGHFDISYDTLEKHQSAGAALGGPQKAVRKRVTQPFLHHQLCRRYQHELIVIGFSPNESQEFAQAVPVSALKAWEDYANNLSDPRARACLNRALHKISSMYIT